jgi:hypothetical protein
VYVSEISKNTYVLNTTMVNFATAEQTCNDNGGHLITHASLAEQQEVEKYFSDMGYLFPSFHKNYWIGYMSEMWPNFRWIDRLENPGYTHWGKVNPNIADEPNNLYGSETCTIANASQTYQSAWGWSDEKCTMRAPFICKIRRKRPHRCCPWMPLRSLPPTCLLASAHRPATRLPA